MLSFLDSRTPPVELLAFGEPAHEEPAFSRARNRLLADLVSRGFRSIAVESDRVAARAVDDHVRRGGGDPAAGFTHGLGAVGANQDLLTWLRGHNESARPDEQVAFHGFDGPFEMTGAPSPRPYVRHLEDFLGLPHSPAPSDDSAWSSMEAQLDAAASIGRSAEAGALRIRADDLLTRLYAELPRRPGWERARLHGLTALGLLRYHAVAADPAPAAERTSRMLAVRDVLMAQHLLDIRDLERHRGPTLVFAHNRHLQRHPSRWHLAGMDLEWHPAGAIVAAALGDRYAVIAGSIGPSAALGLSSPAADTFEGRLGALTGEGPLFAAPAPSGVARTDGTPSYFALDADTVAQADAIWHVDRFPDAAAAFAARILALLPDTTETQAGPDGPAPDQGWDDHFFFAGEDRMFPYATIVAHDIAGFDDRSRLDRAGMFRVNVDLGRREFAHRFGYGPEAFAEHRDTIDFAATDTLLPHPTYAVQGWASVVNPGERTTTELERLLAAAYARATEREKRKTR